MPQRPQPLAERLRSVLRSDSVAPPPTRSASARHSTPYPGSEFADRLRAAVAARH